MKWILITTIVSQFIYAGQTPTFEQTLHNYLHSTKWMSVQDLYKQRMAEIDKSFLGLFPTYKFSGMFGSEYRKAGVNTPTRLKTQSTTLNMTESFRFGKDYYFWKAREQDRVTHAIRFSDQKSEVLMAGALLHLRGYLMAEKLKILKKRKEISDRNRAQVIIKYEQGLISFSDKEKIIEKIDELDLEQYQMEGSFYQILGQYEAETGVMVSGFELPVLTSWDEYLPKSENEFIKKAIQYDTTVIGAKSQQEAAKLDLMASESQLYPRVDFQVNSMQEHNLQGVRAKNSTENVSITISHDLFASGNDIYDLKIAKAKARLSRINYLQIKRNLEYALHNQWVAFTLSQNTYLYAKRKMDRMKGVIRFDQKQFEAGRIDIKDLLDSEEKLAQAEEMMIDAELKYRKEQMSILFAVNQLDNALVMGIGA
jgi:outer membrane protein TolC